MPEEANDALYSKKLLKCSCVKERNIWSERERERERKRERERERVREREREREKERKRKRERESANGGRPKYET
jgi:hypothetical protein